MTKKSIVTALTLGFLAFALSVLLVTTAQAECQWVAGTCPSDRVTSDTRTTPLVFDQVIKESLCCTKPKLPSEPYATGESDTERQQRFAKECAAQGKLWSAGKCIDRPIKNIGKNAPRETGKPRSPVLMKADCESRGHRYDADTGQCVYVKKIGKKKLEGAPE